MTISLMSLLATVALVSLQYTFTNAHMDSTKLDLDNSLQPNVIPAPRTRRFRKFVNISHPPAQTAELVPGSTLELECGVMGSPAPTVQWLKNGEPITDYEDESNELIPVEPTSLASVTSILIINTISPNAEDIYTCVATAGMKTKSASTTVYSRTANEADEIVSLEKLLNIPTKPRIVMYFVDLFQGMGTNVILPCHVFSYQKSQIYWQDNNDNLVYGNSRLRVLPSGELLINSLRWSDMGQYTCNVKNQLGQDSATTFVYPLKTKAH